MEGCDKLLCTYTVTHTFILLTNKHFLSDEIIDAKPCRTYRDALCAAAVYRPLVTGIERDPNVPTLNTVQF